MLVGGGVPWGHPAGLGTEKRPSLSHSTSTRLFCSPQKGRKSLIMGSWSTAPPRGGLPSPWHRLVSGRQALCLSLSLPAPGTGPAWQVTLIADTLRAPALCPLPAACAVIQPISQVERPRPREAEWLARDKHLEVDTRTHPRHFGPRGGLCDHWATLPLSTRVE